MQSSPFCISCLEHACWFFLLLDNPNLEDNSKVDKMVDGSGARRSSVLTFAQPPICAASTGGAGGQGQLPPPKSPQKSQQ